MHSAAQLVYQDVKVSEIIIDRQKAHVRPCRAPISNENRSNPGALQRRHKAMTRSEIGYRCSVERERRANQGRHSFGGGRKIPQPHRKQFKRHAVLRRPLRFTGACPRLSFNGEVGKLPSGGRSELTGRFGNKGRPEESRRRELRTVQSVHRSLPSRKSPFAVSSGRMLQRRSDLNAHRSY
jgi:hypothetical protein